MAFYGRHGILDGNTITLRAVFVDAAGVFVDPSSPVVYIYDPDVSSDLIDEEVEASSFTSATAGPLTPTKLATGLYELSYAVPADTAPGVWRDVWVGSVNSTSEFTKLTFTVINGAIPKEQKILENEFIIVELDKSIASYTGLELEETIQLGFITRLNPFYASVDLVRMEVGPWIDFIPDTTLALMIHWASKEADFTVCKAPNNSERLRFALAKFVIYDTALKTLFLPGGSNYQPTAGSGATKWLGDLRITAGAGSQLAKTASGIDMETLNYMRGERNEWFRVINAGGNITYGQSYGYSTPVKGEFNPDRRFVGRLWLDPELNDYAKPGINTKVLPYGSKKGKFYFQTRTVGR